MKRLVVAAVLSVGLATPAATAEMITNEKCADKQCQDSFGHRPIAYCEASSTKTALGETVTSHDGFYANYEKDGRGGWLFDVRTNTERTSLRFSDQEFDETTGRFSFTFRNSTVNGICRRFSGQKIASRRVDRHPYLSPQPVDAAPDGYRWGEWQRMPQIFGGR